MKDLTHKYIDYYKNGNVKRITYTKNNKCHRKNGPAIIEYYANGIIKMKEYLVNGKLHKIKGPAAYDYYSNGILKEKTYFNKKYKKYKYDINGKLLCIYYDVDDCFIKNKPYAIEYKVYNGKNKISAKWYKLSKNERLQYNLYDDKIYKKIWYKNNIIPKFLVAHRENGPAEISYSKKWTVNNLTKEVSDLKYIKIERYFKNGLKHREDGPAYIQYNNRKKHIEYFFINDQHIDNELVKNNPTILTDQHLRKILI